MADPDFIQYMRECFSCPALKELAKCRRIHMDVRRHRLQADLFRKTLKQIIKNGIDSLCVIV
jgi:hypothetical protein